MELYNQVIESVVHPTAAWAPDLAAQDVRLRLGETTRSDSWCDSLLNPKNRIDSLEPHLSASWRVDGCSGLGTQFYAIPTFLSKIPPMRMDVFIPEDQTPRIREQLDLAIAFHTKDGSRLSRLAVSSFITRVLQRWLKTDFVDYDDFEKFYRGIPFGSRLVFENLSLDIREVRVMIGLNHNLERQLMSLSSLSKLWQPSLELPEMIDFFELQVVKVLHDSVCLVRFRGELFIFKALTSDAKYLYHELKTLCTLSPHPNIIARPRHIVQKHCKFGSKKAIVGFTTHYHAKGTIRDILPSLQAHNRLETSTQFKWSIQLACALEHLRFNTNTYYPDLRLDNMVLSDDDDIVMVDFEQRGVWCEFAAPEVNAIEYLRLLATQEDFPEDLKATYLAKLIAIVPEYEELQQEKYTNPKNGYNPAFLALSPREQEAAEVYMLGRVLWCIFEGVSGPQKAAVWQSYRWEPHLEFPEYQRCPASIRSLIDDCTKGRRVPLSRTVMRRKSRMVLQGELNGEHQTPQNVIAAASTFWKSEIEFSTNLLDNRTALRRKGEWNDNFFGRPSLREVLGRLKEIQGRVSVGKSI
ncbi:protein kinase [Microdochium nivale]|nr:protein kinase [Microdochium nivale]